MKRSIFWFRRDLRLHDNAGLFFALRQNEEVLPVFIFDENILDDLPEDDARLCFIYDSLKAIHTQLKNHNSSILCLKGDPEKMIPELAEKYAVDAVYTNKDYEPYAINRDTAVKEELAKKNISLNSFKDQVIFEENEILKDDGKPYTVFTPYKNKWLKNFTGSPDYSDMGYSSLIQEEYDFPSLESIGFKRSSIKVKDYNLAELDLYADMRNFPASDKGSYLGPHLRFGTISVRQIIGKLSPNHSVFMSELIWREFFMQILFHFPHVVNNNFRAKYDRVQWLNRKEDFDRWCEGMTGYPMVDAGMRELNATGYMHNRVRMITASFLCKHLLVDWRWGEAYFARKLLDYELSSNNGNWQWAAGTGCDAAPYFRVFNPIEQLKKFDGQHEYVKKWIPELNTDSYVKPIVEHKAARERALSCYKEALQN